MAYQRLSVVITDLHLHPRNLKDSWNIWQLNTKRACPCWPQSNGEVEQCNETLLKIVRIARLQGKAWRKALTDFLFQYRVTLHTVTGISPAELLMGRKLRDKLPKVQIPKGRATEAQWQLLLKERDARAKLIQKEYADRTRAAKFSDIEEGDSSPTETGSREQTVTQLRA